MYSQNTIVLFSLIVCKDFYTFSKLSFSFFLILNNSTIRHQFPKKKKKQASFFYLNVKKITNLLKEYKNSIVSAKEKSIL